MRVSAKAISLGSKRVSRLRRSSGKDHGNEDSTRENSVAARKCDQKPKTLTHDTDKEAVTTKKRKAATRSSRKRNSDKTSTAKQITAYPEDVSMMTDELGKRD